MVMLVLLKTTAKLKIGDLLTNMFRSLLALSPEDLRAAVYLTVNKLAPEYEGVEQNLGPSTVKNAIAEVRCAVPCDDVHSPRETLWLGFNRMNEEAT